MFLRLCSWPEGLYLARGRLRWPGQAWLLTAASWFPSGCGKWQRGVRVVSSSAALPRDQLNLRTGFMPWSPAREQDFRAYLSNGRMAASTCVSVSYCVACVCLVCVLWDLEATCSHGNEHPPYWQIYAFVCRWANDWQWMTHWVCVCVLICVLTVHSQLTLAVYNPTLFS